MNGTEAVLEGCQKADTVKRLVVTSSIAAIMSLNSKDFIYDEACWNATDARDVYERSKTLAEKAAWDFVKKTGAFELVTINPSIVIGPIISKSDFTSGEFIRKVLIGTSDSTPEKFSMPFVDIRDVARAHLQAILVPNAAGERFILSNDLMKPK